MIQYLFFGASAALWVASYIAFCRAFGPRGRHEWRYYARMVDRCSLFAALGVAAGILGCA